MKTILVVEDSKAIQDAVKLTMEGRARCLRAETLSQASFLFVRHWDEIDAILVDGSVPVGNRSHEEMSPEEWVRRVRNIGFEKPMVAFSADPGSQRRLMEAGCENDKQFAKGEEPLGKLLELLGIFDIPLGE